MELIKCINSLKDVDHDKMFLGNVRQNLAQSGREILIIILCYDRFKHSIGSERSADRATFNTVIASLK